MGGQQEAPWRGMPGGIFGDAEGGFRGCQGGLFRGSHRAEPPAPPSTAALAPPLPSRRNRARPGGAAGREALPGQPCCRKGDFCRKKGISVTLRLHTGVKLPGAGATRNPFGFWVVEGFLRFCLWSSRIACDRRRRFLLTQSTAGMRGNHSKGQEPVPLPQPH